ncbi:hypothetical protein AHAS_Ahas20G0133000 [Arachis hypogaea]
MLEFLMYHCFVMRRVFNSLGFRLGSIVVVKQVFIQVVVGPEIDDFLSSSSLCPSPYPSSFALTFRPSSLLEFKMFRKVRYTKKLILETPCRQPPTEAPASLSSTDHDWLIPLPSDGGIPVVRGGKWG